MLNSSEIAIVSGARTPMGRYCGKLRDFTAMELGAVAAKEAIRRAGMDPKEFDHCVIGNAQQTSGDSLYGARHVALRAGLPQETPALTVNRLCGSGMQAIVSAAQMIMLGEARAVLAGGMESMSQAPHVIHGMRWGVGLGEGKLEDSLMVALLDSYCGLYMANTAELYAGQQGITREMQDEFALRSQRLAGEAQRACRLQEEIAPVPLKNQAEAGVRQERLGHSRQRQRDRGRRGGGGDRPDGTSAEARPETAGANCELGDRRSGSQDHGPRPGAGLTHRAGKGRDQARGH
jgi:acetyl-CoA acetyltransferase family protein